MNKILFNSVICLNCGEQLISRHVHDYKTCTCENETMVDGGLEYARFGGKDLNLVQSFVLDDSEPFETLRRYIERGSRGKDGKQPLKYVKLMDIDDEYLDSLIKYEEELRPENPYLAYYKKEKKFRKSI